MVGCNILFDMAEKDLDKKKVTAKEIAVTNTRMDIKVNMSQRKKISNNVMKYNAQNAQRTPKNV